MSHFQTNLVGPSQEGPIFVPDLVQLGLDIAIELASPLRTGELQARAREQGFSIRSATGLGIEGVRLELPIRCSDRLLGIAQLDLAPVPLACGVRFASRSALSFNPITLTRSLHFAEMTELSLDGRSNFLAAPTAMDGEFLARALSLVGLVADTARTAIQELLPSGSVIRSEKVRLRAVEAAHDFSHPDATGVVLAACNVAVCQGRIDRHDVYYRSGMSHDRVPTARHQATKNGAWVKVYPKTRGIVRIEVSCPTRIAVKALCGVRHCGLAGDQVVGLVAQFLEAAHSMGVAALEDVRAIAGNAKSLPVLIRSLEPLLRAAEGAAVSGGYRLKKTDRAAAEQAYQDILQQGRHWARGAKTNSGLRRVLDSLCATDGPLRKAARGPWYFLKCDFARAVHGLSERDSQRQTESTRAVRTKGEQERGKQRRGGKRRGENGCFDPLARR